MVLAQVAAPLRGFLINETGSAGLLLAATLAALLWANSPWSASYEALWHTPVGVRVGSNEFVADLRAGVSDGLMALFFFLVGLEVRHELSVGELTDRRRLVIPVLAALGGMAVPALLYLALNPSGEAAHGWGVVIGTDTAFLLGALALVGPSSATQLRVFLLTLSIADDVVAVSVIGLAYSNALDPAGLAVAGLCLAVVAGLGRLRVWHASAYALVAVTLWLAVVVSGLHPTIAGMAAGLLIGAHPPNRAQVEQAAVRFRAFRQSPLPSVGYSAKRSLQRALSVNERMQQVLHPWVSYLVVPLFALANAGVDLRGGLLGEALASPVTWGVVLGLVVGKVLGIGGAALGAARRGLGALPQGVQPAHVLGGAALSGIGFTVSLLIAGLAFDSPLLRREATVGVLLSLGLSTLVGWLVFWAAAALRGVGTADLPTVLDPPVDVRRDHVRGPTGAPLTLVEYADFECPFCARATGVTHELRQRFGDELRYVFRHLPLPDVHPHAELAAEAAEAAAAQGHFWEMHDLLFSRQDQLEFEDLIAYAAELGLDVERFTRDVADRRYAKRVREDAGSAEASGARHTPTFFVNGARHIGPYDAEALSASLRAARGEPSTRRGEGKEMA